MSKRSIVIFEDDGKDREKLTALFKKELKGTAIGVEAFSPGNDFDIT